jgi:hypothetical protein
MLLAGPCICLVLAEAMVSERLAQAKARAQNSGGGGGEHEEY